MRNIRAGSTLSLKERRQAEDGLLMNREILRNRLVDGKKTKFIKKDLFSDGELTMLDQVYIEQINKKVKLEDLNLNERN